MKIVSADLTHQITLVSGGHTMRLTHVHGELKAMPYGVMITRGTYSRIIPWHYVESFEVDHTST